MLSVCPDTWCHPHILTSASNIVVLNVLFKLMYSLRILFLCTICRTQTVAQVGKSSTPFIVMLLQGTKLKWRFFWSRVIHIPSSIVSIVPPFIMLLGKLVVTVLLCVKYIYCYSTSVCDVHLLFQYFCVWSTSVVTVLLCVWSSSIVTVILCVKYI